MVTPAEVTDPGAAAPDRPPPGGAGECERPTRRIAWEAWLLWGGVLFLFSLLVGGTRPWEDFLLLALLVVTTGGGTRSVAFVLAAALTWASGPGLQWPTYWICLTPLAGVWRSAAPARRWPGEAFLVGFVTCWLGTPFIRDGLPSNGWVPHLFGCGLAGVQRVGVALALRAARRLPPVTALAEPVLLVDAERDERPAPGIPTVPVTPRPAPPGRVPGARVAESTARAPPPGPRASRPP